MSSAGLELIKLAPLRHVLWKRDSSSPSCCFVLQRLHCYSELCALLCFCKEEIVEHLCGNNFCAEVAPLLCWITGGKKWLVLGAQAEPSGSESCVLLLTFFIWLRGKTVFDLRCREAGRLLGFGPKQRESELKWRSWQSQGWWRSTHAQKQTHAEKYMNAYTYYCVLHFLHKDFRYAHVRYYILEMYKYICVLFHTHSASIYMLQLLELNAM